MKKRIFFLSIVIVVLFLQIVGHAQNIMLTENDIIISSGNLSDEKIELLKSNLENKSQYQIQGNILCIFGHDLEKGTGEYTEHNYFLTDPKCRKTLFTYEICKRSGCDYSKIVITGYQLLYCH